uniref:glutathione transferase n=1 Tax=Panagrolaimus davidi TaxID=227884 RepID=A0A914QZI8_9BILA
MSNLKLSYLNFRFLAEPARLILHYSGVNFEDERLNFNTWDSVKQTSPFKTLPILTINGNQQIGQSMTINRYLAKKYKLNGKTEMEDIHINCIAEYFREMTEKARPFIRFMNRGIGEGTKEEIYQKYQVPNVKTYFPVIVQLLKQSKSDFFADSGITWIDFFISEYVDSVQNLDPELAKQYPELLEHSLKMATKSDKYSFIEQSFTTSQNRYYNLNLNQSKKRAILISVQSNSKTNYDNYCASDNYEEKEKSQTRNKSFKTFTNLSEDNSDLKKRWKNGNTLNTTNKSILSLNISAYKNSTETVASDLFDVDIEGLKKEKFESVKTYKQSFIGTFKSQNPFEFPRQQNGNQRNESEVMQFSASQRLLCSQPPTLSQQSVQNEAHITQPQMAPGYGTAGKTWLI